MEKVGSGAPKVSELPVTVEVVGVESVMLVPLAMEAMVVPLATPAP